ncbi:DoxX family protein [Flavobacterium litorale]|uniref:DoxX family protein n=1 Tax=Flavobacterium litorale TaxID=2856519 RepID=A0ABX8V859_9FLAO|nr:DoxX family protein [Flavobacterium litorale]QYJ69022.1 DoxX family protein [Flavobacterium litorale]
MTYAAIIAVLLFLAITFIQSGYDKATDWKGNINWLKGHFADTFLKDQVPLALLIILIMEVITGFFSLMAIIKLLMFDDPYFAFLAACFSCATLLMLLLGQRVAKDYDGARTIVIYFIPTVLLLAWL